MANNDSTLDLAFSALGDSTRRAMVQMLLREGSLRVSALAEPFDMSLGGASKHIGILEKAALVKRTKSGREVIVEINPKPLIQVQDWLGFHEKFWLQSFNKLDQLLNDQLS